MDEETRARLNALEARINSIADALNKKLESGADAFVLKAAKKLADAKSTWLIVGAILGVVAFPYISFLF